MRLFIGIPFDEALRRTVWRETSKHQALISKGRFSDWEGYHLTLKFLGEVPEIVADELKQRMTEHPIKHKPFEMLFGELGHFTKRRGDILWLGIKPCQALITVQREVDQFAQNIGFTPDEESYMPHFTLARGVRYQTDFEAIHKAWALESPTIRVDQIALFQSVQVDGKLSYVPLLIQALDAAGIE